MKTKLPSLIAVLLGFSLLSASAQPGGMGGPKTPGFGGSLTKLLGDNKEFSSAIEIQTKAPSRGTLTIPGQMYFNEGKSRMQLDMSKSMGANMPPEAVAQIKAMGMDSIVIIARPEKKISYMAFPGLKAYFETEIPDTETAEATSKFKVASTELGQETVDGHPCIKNKFIVTDDKGTNHESIVWNATDLKKFPVKLETTEQGQPITIFFKDVKLAKPDEALFSPPTDFKRYDNYMALMQQEVMKRMQGAGAVPPRQR
jgi:Domain of unknown function (DUF4412)